MKSHKKMNEGFSLVEIIIVVSIAASIVLVVSNLSGNISGLNSLVSSQLQSKSDINQTLQIMTTEIRSAGPAQNGAYPIDVAGTSTFSFYSDIDKDGKLEHVRYFLATSSIDKGVIRAIGTPATYPTATEVITDVIDNLILNQTSTPLFTYYDDTYTGTQNAMTQPVDISKIRLVAVSFYSDVQPKQAPAAEYFSTVVDIRNLRDN